MATLPVCRLREAIRTLDLARHFDLRQPTLAMLFELLGGRRRAALEDHAGLDRLAPVSVGDADYGRLDHGRVRVEYALDFRRIDIEAADDNHVFLSQHNVGVAVLIHARDVP